MAEPKLIKMFGCRTRVCRALHGPIRFQPAGRLHFVRTACLHSVLPWRDSISLQAASATRRSRIGRECRRAKARSVWSEPAHRPCTRRPGRDRPSRACMCRRHRRVALRAGAGPAWHSTGGHRAGPTTTGSTGRPRPGTRSPGRTARPARGRSRRRRQVAFALVDQAALSQFIVVRV